MSTKAELRITGDHYPGVHHPAVKHALCPTCGALRGDPCIVTRPRSAEALTRSISQHTRTHRTRLNRYRVVMDRKRAKA